MSFDRKQKLKVLLAGELNLCRHGRERGGQLSVCLVSPGRYQTGMSSLGFQTVYSLLASSPGILCERAFLPERSELEENSRRGQPLLSLETQRPLSDFDVIAFSTSFEPDYVNIPLMLSAARIPIWSHERSASHPLVIAGGAAFFINPEPVADFLDVICIGEGEVLVPELTAELMTRASGDRQALLERLALLPGFYVPRFHHPRYEADRLTGYDTDAGIPAQVRRVCAVPEQHPPARSVILTDNTEFGGMFLIEVSRGCPRGCRFCTSGFVYGPFRQQPFDHLAAAVEDGLTYRGKIGLVGAAVSDHRDIGKLCRLIVDRGARFRSPRCASTGSIRT